jgi:hypothetical protein
METKNFSLRDLYLASTLISLGFEMTGIDYQLEGGEKGEKLVGYFNFDYSDDIVEAEKKYWAGKLAIEPKSFITNLKGIRSQLKNTNNGPRVDVNKYLKK